MPTNRVDCSMTRPPVPEAPRQTIRRDPRSSTHRDDGSPLQAGYGHEVYEDGTLTRGTSTPPWSRMERALEANRTEIETAVKFSFDHPARLLTESIRTPLS